MVTSSDTELRGSTPRKELQPVSSRMISGYKKCLVFFMSVNIAINNYNVTFRPSWKVRGCGGVPKEPRPCALGLLVTLDSGSPVYLLHKKRLDPTKYTRAAVSLARSTSSRGNL